MGRKINTKKPFSCTPVLTEEDIEWLEFGIEEWVDALERIEGKEEKQE